MCITKITEFKNRLNVYPSEENQEVAKDGYVGFFNAKGQYCIRPEDLPIIYKQFDLLYVNRIQFFGKLAEDKKSQKT